MQSNLKVKFFAFKPFEQISNEDGWIEKFTELRKLFSFTNIVNVIVFDSLNEISKYLGIKVPNWVVGCYERNNLLVLNYDLWRDRKQGTLAQIMIHEFVHIIISNLTKYRCPVWLNEGLAMYFAEQDKSVSIMSDINNKNIYELGYEDSEFYSICAKVVEKLIRVYGFEKIEQKLKSLEEYENDEVLGIDNMKRIVRSLKCESTTNDANLFFEERYKDISMGV